MTKTLSERIADIEQLNQDILRSNKGELNGEEISGTFEMAIKIISKLQAENQALLTENGELEGNGWLPIESAEIGKWVLVATAKIAMKAFVDTKANCGTDLIIIGDDGREYQDFVTHWMPLPELPTKIKGE